MRLNEVTKSKAESYEGRKRLRKKKRRKRRQELISLVHKDCWGVGNGGLCLGKWQLVLWEVIKSPGPLLGSGLGRDLAEVLAHEEVYALIGEWVLGGPKLPSHGRS